MDMNMKSIKILPLSLLVAAACSSSSVFADDSLTFSGYARYGMHYTSDGNDYVTASGQFGNDTGRLGNEGNGGEFQFTKAFEGESGSQWTVAVMLENWWRDYNSYDYDVTSDTTTTTETYESADYADVSLKKFYAAGTNVLASQPNATIWAGRNFHQRGQLSLNDYYYMRSDGQGAGIENLELGGLKLNLSMVGQTDGTDWDGTGDNGDYAFASKLSGLKFGNTSVELDFNYGFSDDTSDEADIKAAQAVAVVTNGSNKVVVMYGDNIADNDMLTKSEDTTHLYTALEGGYGVDDSLSVDYLLGYHNYEDGSDDRSTYNVIVRANKSWNSVHSTWVEAGYTLVDYDDLDDANTAAKVTVSQNIAVGSKSWSRPMIRLYATIGSEDTQGTTDDVFAVGAMWEAWW
jgi:maltoporin